MYMAWQKLIAGVAVSLAAFSVVPATAADFPNKPVKIIVANAPGGPSDNVARTISDKLAQIWSQPVVIENKAGAGGILGTDAAAKSAADGYTFNLISTPHVTNPALRQNLPYDSVKDFTAVSKLAEGPQILVVNPKLGVSTVAELIALAKSNPATVRAGNPGNGTGPHLAAALFESLGGVEFQHIPYTGAAATTAAVVAGEIDVYFDTPANAKPQMDGGNVKALAVTGSARAPQFPDLPTVAEVGVAGYQYITWNALAGPAGIPAEIVSKVNADIQTVLAMPDVQGRFNSMGFVTAGSTSAELGDLIASDIETWTKVIKEAGIEAK